MLHAKQEGLLLRLLAHLSRLKWPPRARWFSVTETTHIRKASCGEVSELAARSWVAHDPVLPAWRPRSASPRARESASAPGGVSKPSPKSGEANARRELLAGGTSPCGMMPLHDCTCAPGASLLVRIRPDKKAGNGLFVLCCPCMRALDLRCITSHEQQRLDEHSLPLLLTPHRSLLAWIRWT